MNFYPKKSNTRDYDHAKAEKMTNEEFMKDFEDFQKNWEQENNEALSEISTMIS